MRLILSFSFFLFYQLSLKSQVLIPRMDETPHKVMNVVHSLNVTKDKKYILTSDNIGELAYRDVETGKIIWKGNAADNLIATSFLGDDNQKVLEIYFITDGENQKYIELNRWDVMTDENNGAGSFPVGIPNGNPASEFEFHASEDLMSFVIRSYDDIWFYNHDVGWAEKLGVFPGLATINFIGNSNELIELGMKSNDRISKIQVNLRNGEQRDIEPSSLKKMYKHLNHSKVIYQEERKFKFSDLRRGLELGVEKKSLYDTRAILDEGFTVNDFEFSPDGSTLAICYGQPSYFTSTYGSGMNENGEGYVAVVDCKTATTKWVTNPRPNEPLYNMIGVEWLSERNFIVSSYKGELIFYSSDTSLAYRTIGWPKIKTTALDISDDFSKIIYSVFNNNTYTFETEHTQPVQLIDTQFYHIVHTSTDSISAYGKFHHGSYFIRKNQKKIFSNRFCEVEQIVSSRNERYVAIAEQMTSVSMSLSEDILEVLKNSDGQVKGYRTKTSTTYDAEFEDTGQSYVERSPCSHQVVYDIKENKAIELKYKGVSGPATFSYNSELISFGSEYGGIAIFDIPAREWINFQNMGEIKMHIFDENSNRAFTLYDSVYAYVWDTRSRKLLSQWKFNEEPSEVLFIPGKDEVLIRTEFASTTQYNYLSHQTIMPFVQIENGFKSVLSPTGSHIATRWREKKLSSYFEGWDFRSTTYEDEDRFPFYIGQVDNSLGIGGSFRYVYYHRTKPLVFIYDGFGTLYLEKLTPTGAEHLAIIRLFNDGEWLVICENGLFDGSPKGREQIYYLADQEIILYDQIGERYWTPGLLEKLLYRPHLLSDYKKNLEVGLYPEVTLSLDNKDGLIKVHLNERSGGMGKVSLKINDKEVVDNINVGKNKDFTFNVRSFRKYLFEEDINKISVLAYNKDNSIRSREQSLFLETHLATGRSGEDDNDPFQETSRRRRTRNLKHPRVHGLFVGTSKYMNPKMNLAFADKDAKELMKGFEKIGEKFYDQNEVNFTLLTSEANTAENVSSRENILASLNKIAEDARPEDIVILFFSGHGMTIGDDFYYLTKSAGNVDLEYNEVEREKKCVSSKKINEALRKITATKQVMILDACHSGKIAELLEGTSKANSTSQQKALETLQDKMGVYILASSESNQKSYETEALSLGILTFNLLRGMSGEASDQKMIQIVDLLSYASNATAQYGIEKLGKSQQPVLGVSSGSSYPIGFLNEDLKVELPKNKIPMGVPSFGILPVLKDPENLRSKVNAILKERGGLGSSENFIYEFDDERDGIVSLTGTYSYDEDEIKLKWYLLKNQKEWKGPFELVLPKAKSKKIPALLIDKMILELD